MLVCGLATSGSSYRYLLYGLGCTGEPDTGQKPEKSVSNCRAVANPPETGPTSPIGGRRRSGFQWEILRSTG